MSDHEEFLDSTMVDTGDIVVLLNEGAFKDPEETTLPRVVFQIRVKIPDGRKKTWTMNKTTRKRLVKAWGDDSEGWINKNVEIKITQQMVAGDMKDVLWGTPTDKPQHEVTLPEGQIKIETPKEPESTINVDEVVKNIAEAKSDLSTEAIKGLIEKQREDLGGMISMEGAAILVATELGIYREGKPIQ